MKKTEIISRAKAKFLRISPRKVRQVIDLIRGERAAQALVILAHINKRAAKYVEKALSSAISNARGTPHILADNLFISKITADNGPMLKRYRAQAMGRATMIRRRMTHLTIELSKSVEEKPRVGKKQTKDKGKR